MVHILTCLLTKETLAYANHLSFYKVFAIRITPLVFADDKQVFCYAKVSQILNLRQILIWFQVVSRHHKMSLKICEIMPVGVVDNIGEIV